MALHVDTYGAEGGNTHHLVMLHGWGMHSGVWQPIVKRLTHHFVVHLVDLPGMGNSQSIEPYHLDALAEKVAEIVPGQADICGWSLGAQVAMRLAMIQPECVRRTILVGATPCFINSAEFDTRTEWTFGVDGDVFYNFAAQVKQDYQNTFLKFLTLMCMGASDARATVRTIRECIVARPIPTVTTLQNALRVLVDTDLRNQIDTLRKPVLLIHGDRDTLAPVQAAHWMAQYLPFGRLRVISGASHAPFLSHSDQFIEALVQFLEPAV